MGIATLVCEGG
jgi:hypothetical protein